MTDEDRVLLDELNRLGDALGPFSGGILTNSLSVTEQLDFGHKLIAAGGRIRARLEKEPIDHRSQALGGDAS